MVFYEFRRHSKIINIVTLLIFCCYRKLRTVLTNRFLKFMADQAQKDPVKYDAFYKDYSLFLKEGIVISQSPLERVSSRIQFINGNLK